MNAPLLYTWRMFLHFALRRLAAIRAGLVPGMLLLAPSPALERAIMVCSVPTQHQAQVLSSDGLITSGAIHFTVREGKG